MTAPHKKWLKRADDDLKFAMVGIESGFYSQVCFLSQQAIEKSLKSWLLFTEDSYPKIHKLVELGKLCRELREELKLFQEKLKIIDEYYIPVRYPDAVPGSLSSGEPSEDNARSIRGRKKNL